jgi:2-C-methyl-D-erythritol 4-phosphate cytidylyltransferase
MVSAIIVAAGSSRRMGFDKLFAPLAGKPVLWHSIKAFSDAPEIHEIIIVTKEDHVEEVQAMVAKAKFSKVSKVLPGGDERHESVWIGLQQIESKGSEFVAIHDGARPQVTPELISRCIARAREVGAVGVASPIPDTVKRATPEEMVSESVDRSGLWAMQTPQIFASGLIMQAYAAIISKHEMVTDEISAVQKLGKRIALLRNDDWNFKITFPQDFELAEHVLALRSKRSLNPPVPATS